jgi:hypothetical protein
MARPSGTVLKQARRKKRNVKICTHLKICSTIPVCRTVCLDKIAALSGKTSNQPQRDISINSPGGFPCPIRMNVTARLARKMVS